MDEIKYIKKVEIKNLWNRYDIEWNLNKDVNILAGINGSGKSTVLNLIFGALFRKKIDTMNLVSEIKIEFNKNKCFIYKRKPDDTFTVSKIQIKKSELKIDIIKSFDSSLKYTDQLRKIIGVDVNSQLDAEIYLHQREYLNYQLDILKKTTKQTDIKEIQKLSEKTNLFFDMIDSLFKESGKRVDRDENEISFLYGKQKITTNQLSSGEKQMLLILLKTLLQNEKPTIFFMDEPELSLHTDWQEKLIENIRKLNSNAQIIIATHSPSIVVDGWMDKVFEMPEIIVKERNV